MSEFHKIKSSSKTISIGTTSARLNDPRNVYPKILESLIEFRINNQGWDIPDQKLFALLLGSNDVFDIKDTNSIGSDKDSRVKTAFLHQLGFVSEGRIVTDVGNNIVEDHGTSNEFDIPNDSYIYLKQFLKYQFEDDDFKLYPLLSLIYCCIEFDNNLPKDFFIYYWSTSKTRQELKENICNYKKFKNVYESLYNDCVNSQTTIQASNNCDIFFSNYEISDNKQLIELLFSILPHGKGDTFKKKTINLFIDLYKYWINKNKWSLDRKREFISKELKSRHKDINSLKSSFYQKKLFNTNKFDLDSDWNNIILFFEDENLMSSTTNKDFIVNFHIFYMYIKKITLCMEYEDLNVRHLKLLDILIFEYDSIQLEMTFYYYFKSVKENLLNAPKLESDEYKKRLESNQNSLSKIHDFLLINIENILLEIENSHPEVKELGLKNFNKLVKEKRLIALTEKVFNRQNIIILLKILKDRNSLNRKKIDNQVRRWIKEKYSPYLASITALFEYLIGLSFYWIFDKQIKLIDILDTGLDSNLLPKSHAAGGRADLILKSKTKHYLIEVTLSENDGQRKMESEPVPRHLARYILDKESNSLAFFVAHRFDPNNLVVLRNYKFSRWYSNDKHVPSMDIMPLSISNIIYILENKISFETIEKEINKLINSQTKDGKLWYENEVNKYFKNID